MNIGPLGRIDIRMISWVKRTAGRVGGYLRGKTLTASEIFGGILAGLTIHKHADFESYLRAGSKTCWAAFKGCDVVAKTCLDTPMYLVDPDGESVQVPGLSELMAEPSEHYTWEEMIYLFAFHMKLTGNAFWVKDQANLAGDRPRRLLPLNPKRMRAAVDKDTGVSGWLYRVNGVDIPWDPQEVIHFRNPHPNQDVMGLGEVEAGEALFNDFLNRQESNDRFWANGATPSGVLMCSDPITDRPAFEEAKRRFNREYGGVPNRGKIAWLTGNWRYEKLGLSATEMQSLEQTKYGVESILHLLGVPLSVAGVRDAANFATARVDEMIFRRYTVKPLLRILTSTLKTDLVNGYDPKVRLLAEVTGLVDAEAVVQHYGPLFDRGVLSINELRQMLGLSKVDEAVFDSHYINAGLVPLDLAGIGPAGDTAERAARVIMDRVIAGAAPHPPSDRVGSNGARS